jgi:hypothetical protein
VHPGFLSLCFGNRTAIFTADAAYSHRRPGTTLTAEHADPQSLHVQGDQAKGLITQAKS